MLYIAGTWSNFSLCCLAHEGIYVEVYKLSASCYGQVPIGRTVQKGKEKPTL